jgi:hypothetical protein
MHLSMLYSLQNSARRIGVARLWIASIRQSVFPENYMMIYESELSQFEMFKEEIPKLRAIAQEHIWIKLEWRIV